MTQHPQERLGAKLKQARSEARIKQKQVAGFLNVSISVVSAMENGQRKIDALELFSLSKIYGKPLSWFFEDLHPMESPGYGIRWYDNDPLIREAISLMEKIPLPLQRRVAYGILGFLSEG